MLSRLNELSVNHDKKEPQALDELDEIAEKYDETVDSHTIGLSAIASGKDIKTKILIYNI